MSTPQFRKRRPIVAMTMTALLVVLPICPAQIPNAATTSTPSPAEQAAVAAMPAYKPATQVTGTIRLWGHGAPLLDFMGMLVNAWQVDFKRFQPGVTFEYEMYGTASAMGALYTGKGDLAILGQEIYPFETTAFERVKGYAPSQVQIATGSVDVRNFDFDIGVFVNSANPLAHMTLEQVDKAFAWHAGGKPQNITTWDQLGLTGDWVGKPIHLYGWHESDIFSTWVEQAALHGSHRWRCGMRQYAHIKNADGTIYDSGNQIADDLAHDRYGLALSSVRYLKMAKEPGAVKELALGRSAAGPFYPATKANNIAQLYPLTRLIPAVYDRAPGAPLDPALREFLAYLLSREGQAQIVANGKYLPLNPEFAAKQREALR